MAVRCALYPKRLRRGEIASTFGRRVGIQGQASWAALMPVDGSLLVGALNNPSNGTLAVSCSQLLPVRRSMRGYAEKTLAGGANRHVRPCIPAWMVMCCCRNIPDEATLHSRWAYDLLRWLAHLSSPMKI